MAQGISTECGKGFAIGGEVYFAPMNVNGRYFHFSVTQTKFLYALTKTKGDVQKAAESVGWTDEQSKRFFTTRKWREYREQILASAGVRNGELRDFWWEFMFDGARGYKEVWEGNCGMCHQEYSLPSQVVEQYRTDDMKMEFSCYICKQPVALEQKKNEFKPTREQVQCAVEIGNRVEPKTERVHHQFSTETYVFAPGDQG